MLAAVAPHNGIRGENEKALDIVHAPTPDVLQGLAAVGDDHDERGNIAAPSVLIERMTVAGSA